MAKQTALGDALYVGASDLSGDVGSISSIASPRAVIDVSSIAVSGYERLLGRADGSINFAAFYNPSAGQAHPILSAVGTVAGTANTLISYAHGNVVGNDVAALYAKQVDYGVTVGQDYSIALAISSQGGAGVPVEWAQMLTTGKQTFASAGTVPGTIDTGASASFGLAGYLHAISIASGTATVAIQDSSDNSSFSNVSGAVFTVVSGATFERISIAKTAAVGRYLRVNVTGTFTNLVALVAVIKYPTSQT